MNMLQRLARLQLVVVTGKGGVGKSALAATLGRVLAEAGRRVLVLEVDPRENVHQMLGVAPSGGEILQVDGGLHLQNLRPRQAIDQVVRERVRFEPLVRRILRSPVYQHFVDGAPGLKETAILGHSLLLVQGRVPQAPELDVVVLDAPATGHGVSLLAAPGLVAEVIGRGPVAAMTEEVAALIRAPARSGIVVVTVAEEMPVTEALELRRDLDARLGRVPELLVANQLLPPAGDDSTPAGPLGDLWRDRRRLNERELARLAEAWDGPGLELPLLPLDRGPALVDALAEAAVERLAEVEAGS